MPHALNGLRVVSFESRRSAEMAELIRNYGGEPIQAPAMREVPLTDQREALAEGRGGEGAGTAHAGLPRAQTDRRAQGGWPRAGARGARAEYLARPAFGAGPQAPGRGKARRRSGV